jgi:predicted secreted protein
MINRPSKLTPFFVVLLTSSLFGISTANAQPCEKLPSANINAIASQEVSNDMLRMTWSTQSDKSSASDAMIEVNRALETALKSLNKNKEIKNLTSNIQTYPQYTKERDIKSWTSLGTFSFEMRVEDMPKKGNVDIQKPWALNGIQYFVSQPLLEKSRSQLLEQVMTSFQSKANIVAKGFGHSGYVLGDFSVNDQNQSNPRPMYAGRAFSESSSVLPMAKMDVATASGSSDISVSINGMVCLKP